MQHTKKIALVGTTGSSFYGFRADLIVDLVGQGHCVYAFVSEYTPTCLEKIKKLGAIPVPYVLSRGGLNPFADFTSMLALKRLFKDLKPDIVFSFFAKPVIYAAMAAKYAGIALNIGMLEGLGYTFTEQPNGQTLKTKIIRSIQVLLYRQAFKHLDHLILLNADDQKDLMDAYHIKVKALHILGGIGLNLNHYPYVQAPTTPMSFLFIGRLLKEKGIFEFIDAIRLVRQKHPEAAFTVLGTIDAENMGALQQDTLDQLVSENLFEYPGYVTDVVQYINKSSVFVLPSYREGVPRSTQEAMAIGRAVITTDVPGCRETVVDGLNGFLVPKWDAEALAKKMCYFIENPKHVNLMGLESYRIAVEHFDVKLANKKLFAIMGLSKTDETPS